VTLHDDLVDQARRLATLDPKRPKQANLRRSVSSAYFALFHRLISEGANRASRATAKSPLWHVVERRYEHRTMKDVSEAFVKNNVWVASTGVLIPADLRTVADTFVVLQERRHESDYNLKVNLTRTRALEAVDRAEVALNLWNQVRKSEAAYLYLLTMLLGIPRK